MLLVSVRVSRWDIIFISKYEVTTSKLFLTKLFQTFGVPYYLKIIKIYIWWCYLFYVKIVSVMFIACLEIYETSLKMCPFNETYSYGFIKSFEYWKDYLGSVYHKYWSGNFQLISTYVGPHYTGSIRLLQISKLFFYHLEFK